MSRAIDHANIRLDAVYSAGFVQTNPKQIESLSIVLNSELRQQVT